MVPQLISAINSSLTHQQVGEIHTIVPCENLSSSQAGQLEIIKGKFESISFEKCGLGVTNLVEHHIETSGPPIKQRYYNLASQKLKLLEKKLDNMLKLGMVVRGQTLFYSFLKMMAQLVAAWTQDV